MKFNEIVKNEKTITIKKHLNSIKTFLMKQSGRALFRKKEILDITGISIYSINIFARENPDYICRIRQGCQTHFFYGTPVTIQKYTEFRKKQAQKMMKDKIKEGRIIKI